MMEVVLFGVGSSLVVEYAETCARLGIRIAAGVKNREGESFLDGEDRVVGPSNLDRSLLGLACFCPMFIPANRHAAAQEAVSVGFSFEQALVDPTSVIARTTNVGGGTYVNAACVIGARTAIGRQVVVNRGASIGHHVQVHDFASIGPGVVTGAFVEVGAGASIGAGAVLLPKLRIGAHAVVGAGAVVTKDVPARTLVTGNPARVTREALESFDAG
jgi:sugar O-acyltransferase (sialic acid O-acetyltransferase NeuD family)